MNSKATVKKKNGAANGTRNGDELRLKIQKHAYELWEADGGPHGNDLHYWFQAQRDLVRQDEIKNQIDSN